VAITLTVDGHAVAVPPGGSVLDAVNQAGIYLPQLCKDPDRPPLGTCRTCLVSVEGLAGVPTACSTPAHDGMVVRTDAPAVDRLRRGVLQLTLDMLPADDPARLGQLGVAAARYGLRRGRFVPAARIPERHTVDASNPIWLLDRERCILCERCVVGCQDVQHIAAIAILNRSRTTEVGTFRVGPLVESNCTSCGQCWSTCPTQAIRLKAPLTTAAPAASAPAPPPSSAPAAWPPDVYPRGDDLPPIARRVETTCPYCGVGCGLVLDLGPRDEIVQVDDVPENLSSRGMLCVKGRFGVGFVHSPERLTTPLLRREPGGPLEPATWDQALDAIAEQLVRHRDCFAALGSAKATNEDGYVLQKLARAVMGTNNVDHCSRLCHSPSVEAMLEMLGSSATSNSYADYEEAGCLMVVGSDPDTNHPVIAARVRQGVERGGASLIVVNPKRIRLCDLADLWLRPRSGTDVALFNGLAWIALDEGLWDREFVRERTEGFDLWRAHLAPYTPANVADLTGVPAADLHRAAHLFARPAHGGACLLWGMGITQHTRGTANVQAMVNFALLTGQIGKPGSGLSPLRGQNNVLGCSDSGVLPTLLPGYQPLTPAVRARFGQAWGCELPTEPGLKLTEMIDAALNGRLHALYLCGENPLLTEPNLTHARAALERLAYLVVQTTFLNETTEVAHVVLPAATFAEKDGTFTNSERRVQLVRQALLPPGQARADWDITAEIARRVARRRGQPTRGFEYSHPAEVFAEMASLMPALAGMSYERLATGGLQWPCPTPDHPGSPRLFADTFPRGRARFVPVDQGLPAAERPDHEYPLLLNTGRVLYHWHGGDLSRQVPGLVALYPRVEALVHPADAAAAGLRDGAAVRVTSRRGEQVATARVTDTVRQGEVFIPFVRLEDGAANALTNNVFDPRAKIPEYKACAVRIAPA
jgi:formate dehydrogenase alpha subunit